MTLKKTTSETGTHSPVADILNTVSGAYCSEFWDGVYEVSGTLNTLRELKHSFEALYEVQKYKEAFTLLLALHDLIALEIPASVLEMQEYSKVHARKGSSPNYGKFERQGSASNDGRRYPGNVLFVQTVAHPTHPTQKPVELCEYLIKTYTRPGEVVADLCAGSGTTAVAALNTGRRFVCFESAPAIYGPAAQRIEQARLAVERGEKGE